MMVVCYVRLIRRSKNGHIRWQRIDSTNSSSTKPTLTSERNRVGIDDLVWTGTGSDFQSEWVADL